MKTAEMIELRSSNPEIWNRSGQHPSIAGNITVIRHEETGALASLTPDGVERARSGPELLDTIGLWATTMAETPIADHGAIQTGVIAEKMLSEQLKASSRPGINGWSRETHTKYTPLDLPGVVIKSFDQPRRYAGTDFYALGWLARHNEKLNKRSIALTNPIALVRTPARPPAIFSEESQSAKRLRGWDTDTLLDRAIIEGRVTELLSPTDRLLVRRFNRDRFTRDDATGKLFAEDQPSYWSPITRVAVSLGNLASRLSALSEVEQNLEDKNTA
jgi:hypothetical protein